MSTFINVRYILAACAMLMTTAAGANWTDPAQPAVTSSDRGTGFAISRYTINSGGTMFAAGGDWSMAGTIGQHDATEAEALAGGDWQLTGGFWSVGAGQLSEPVIFRDRFEE